MDLELDPKMGASVDYLKVYREARSLAEGREWVLVEDLAEALAGRLLAGFPGLAGLTVRVRKRPAVMPGVEVVVEHASARLGRAARREGR